MGFGCSSIGKGVSEASGDPFDVSGFLVESCGGFAFSVAAEIEVGDGYD